MLLKEVAGATGLEPATTGSTVRNSNQIELRPHFRGNELRIIGGCSEFARKKSHDLQLGQILDIDGPQNAVFSVNNEQVVDVVVLEDFEHVDG